MRRYFGPPRRKRGCLLPLFLLLVIVAGVYVLATPVLTALGRFLEEDEGAGVYVLATPVLTALGRFLEEDEGARKADAIVVLGGDRYGGRIVKAAQLEKAGLAPIVYVSGPPRLMGWESTDEIQFAEKEGYPATLFREMRLPEDAADSTRTEARFLGKYLASQGARSVIVVTSNFHTRRAAKLWRHENPNLSVTVVPSMDPYFTPGTWWKSRQGQKTFALEWMKTISVMLGI